MVGACTQAGPLPVYSQCATNVPSPAHLGVAQLSLGNEGSSGSLQSPRLESLPARSRQPFLQDLACAQHAHTCKENLKPAAVDSGGSQVLQVGSHSKSTQTVAASHSDSEPGVPTGGARNTYNDKRPGSHGP
jgi:uncharacterized membrane protein